MENARDWQTMKVGDVAKLDVDRVAVDEGQHYRIAGVMIAGRGLFWRDTMAGGDTSYAFLHRLRAGQLVYRKLTAWEGPITVVPHEFDGAFVSSEFPTFTLDEQRITPQFMRFVCKQESFRQAMRLRSTGTAERRNRLKPNDLLDIPLLLPPQYEQRQIVEALGSAERAAVAAEVERAAAFELMEAMVEAALPTADSWTELPDGWTLSQLGDVADVRSGITKGRKTDKPMKPRPFLRAANVQNGYLNLDEIKTIDTTDDEAERFRLVPGDVLMVEGSGSPDRLGRGWVWEGEIAGCLHQNHVFRARPDKATIEPRFLAYAIAASPARRYFLASAKTTSGLATINKSQVLNVPIPLPPMATQRAIAERLDAVRAVAVGAARRAQELGVLNDALAESLLHGRRSVRNAAERAAAPSLELAVS